MSKSSYRLGGNTCQSYQIFIFTSRGHLGIQYKTQNNRETGTDGDLEKRLVATEHVGRSPASQPMGEWEGRPERGVAKHFLKQLRWGGLTIQILQRCRCTSFLQWCYGNARPDLQGSFFKTLISELPYALTIPLLSIYLKRIKTYTIHTDRERNTHTHRNTNTHIDMHTYT